MYNREFLFNGIGSKPEKLLVNLPAELKEKLPELTRAVENIDFEEIEKLLRL